MSVNAKHNLLKRVGWNDPNTENQGYIHIKRYDETLNNLFETFATYATISRAQSEIAHRKQLPSRIRSNLQA